MAEKKRLNVLMDGELHACLSVEAKRQGRTMTKLFHCAISSYLGMPMDPDEPKAPSRLTECEHQLRQLVMDLAAVERQMSKLASTDMVASLEEQLLAVKCRLERIEAKV